MKAQETSIEILRNIVGVLKELYSSEEFAKKIQTYYLPEHLKILNTRINGGEVDKTPVIIVDKAELINSKVYVRAYSYILSIGEFDLNTFKNLTNSPSLNVQFDYIKMLTLMFGGNYDWGVEENRTYKLLNYFIGLIISTDIFRQSRESLSFRVSKRDVSKGIIDQVISKKISSSIVPKYRNNVKIIYLDDWHGDASRCEHRYLIDGVSVSQSGARHISLFPGFVKRVGDRYSCDFPATGPALLGSSNYKYGNIGDSGSRIELSDAKHFSSDKFRTAHSYNLLGEYAPVWSQYVSAKIRSPLEFVNHQKNSKELMAAYLLDKLSN